MRSTLLSFALAAATTLGCSEPCPDIGCLSSFRLELSAGRVPFPEGQYVISIRADGALEQAICNLQGSFTCTRVPATARVGVNARRDEITVDVNGTPGVVAIEVQHAGSLLFGGKWEPQYRESQPRLSCGPTCRGATVTETVPERAPSDAGTD